MRLNDLVFDSIVKLANNTDKGPALAKASSTFAAKQYGTNNQESVFAANNIQIDDQSTKKEYYTMTQTQTQEDDFYDYDNEFDTVTLTESDFFPDYELIVSYDDFQLPKFQIHCWKSSFGQDEDSAVLYYEGVQMINSKRWVVEEIMGLSAPALEALFGDIYE